MFSKYPPLYVAILKMTILHEFVILALKGTKSFSLFLLIFPSAALAQINPPNWVVSQPSIGSVQSLDTSPDGTKLASGMGDGTVILWDIVNREQIIILTNGHSRGSNINSVAFSPDGSMLASGAYDQRIILWDVENGKLIRQFLHSNAIQSLDFSPDGTLLASVTSEDVILWDVSTGLEIRKFNGKDDVAFSPDGSVLATREGDFNDRIILYDVSTGVRIKRLGAPSPYDFSGIDFSPDGTLLASGVYSIFRGYPRQIILWDVSTGKKLSQFEGSYPVFSPNGTLMFKNVRDHSLWTATFSQESSSFISDLDVLFRDANWLRSADLAYSRDGTYWVAGGGSSILVHHVDNSQSFTLPTISHTVGIDRLVFSPDETMIASGGEHLVKSQFHPRSDCYDNIAIWDVLTGEPIQSFKGDLGCVLNFSPDGTQIATVDTDGLVSLRDVTSGKTLSVFRPSLEDPTSVAISPNWKLLAYGYDNGAITVQHVETRQLLSNLPFIGHTDEVNIISFSKDGSKLISVATDLIVWDINSGISLTQCKNIINGTVTGLSISPDASQVVLHGAGMFDLTTCSSVELPHLVNYARSFSYNHDGSHLIIAVGTEVSGLSIMDLKNNEIESFFKAPGLSITSYSVSISEDGNFVGFADSKSIRLWEWADRTPVGFTFQIPDQSYPRGKPISPLTLPTPLFPPPYFPSFYILRGLPAGLVFNESFKTIHGTPSSATSSPINMSYSVKTHAFSLAQDFTISVYSPVHIGDEEVPSTFEVVGSYPNPFRSITQLEFNLPWHSEIQLEVMDVTGREVLTTSKSSFSYGRSQIIEINGESLSPGVYLYRLIADAPSGNFIRIGRIVKM